MLPPPQIEESSNDDASTLTGSLTSGSDDTLTGPNNLVSTVANNTVGQSPVASFSGPQDVFSNMGSFAVDELSESTGDSAGGKMVINNQNNTRMVSSLESKGFEGHSILNNLGEQGANGWTEPTNATDLEWQDNLVKTSQGQTGAQPAEKECNTNKTTESDEASDQFLWKQSSTESDVTSGESTWGTPLDMDQTKEEELLAEGSGEGGAAVTTDQWKSCAICLDDMADRDLMVHPSCGGTLCQGCLEVSSSFFFIVVIT